MVIIWFICWWIAGFPATQRWIIALLICHLFSRLYIRWSD